MSTTVKSHVKNGHAYFKNTGGYNEFTKQAKNSMNNNAPSATHQRNLAPKKGNKSAAKAWKELGWK